MKNFLESITRRSGKASIENEVDEELHFHNDMQTSDYESRGITTEESRMLAQARFGDVERIKSEVYSHQHRQHFPNLGADLRFSDESYCGLACQSFEYRDERNSRRYRDDDDWRAGDLVGLRQACGIDGVHHVQFSAAGFK